MNKAEVDSKGSIEPRLWGLGDDMESKVSDLFSEYVLRSINGAITGNKEWNLPAPEFTINPAGYIVVYWDEWLPVLRIKLSDALDNTFRYGFVPEEGEFDGAVDQLQKCLNRLKGEDND